MIKSISLLLFLNSPGPGLAFDLSSENLMPFLLPYLGNIEDTSNLDIQVKPLDERRLQHCKAEHLEVFLPPGSQIKSKTTLGIRCKSPNLEEGPTWSTYAPFEISIKKPVMTLNRNIEAKEKLEPSDIRWVPANVLTLNRGFLDHLETLNGKIARRNLKAGTVLIPDDLQKQKLIQRGQIVSVQARRGTLLVSTQGKALNDGFMGESIKVENLNSKRVIQGTVKGEHEVEVLF
ncbi:MAG: flagellar basal body P-ring formation chaperone FlgA [Gammaproteobacteria bacterium]